MLDVFEGRGIRYRSSLRRIWLDYFGTKRVKPFLREMLQCCAKRVVERKCFAKRVVERKRMEGEQVDVIVIPLTKQF